MLTVSRATQPFQELTSRIRESSAPTAKLFAEIIASCIRLPALASARSQLDALVAAGAWVDAALKLIELELPQWRLRRLAFDDGEWMCSLSQQRNLPEIVDDAADGYHEVLSLAILSAFLEALGNTHAAPQTAVPQVRAITCVATCCDNFA